MLCRAVLFPSGQRLGWSFCPAINQSFSRPRQQQRLRFHTHFYELNPDVPPWVIVFPSKLPACPMFLRQLQVVEAIPFLHCRGSPRKEETENLKPHHPTIHSQEAR
jgi:hypothetical protein